MAIKHKTINWAQLINEVLGTGKTQSEVAAAINRSQPYVADVIKGRYEDVKWADGEKILALYKATFPTKKNKPQEKEIRV